MVLPQELSGVQVRVGAVNAYVEYVSAYQINVLLPATVATGIANLEVTTPAGGFVSSVEVQAVAPGLFSYQLLGKNYAAAVFGNQSGVVYVAPVGALEGETSRSAIAGDVIELYGTGMGPTSPPWPDGLIFAKDYPAANLSAFQVTIGGIACSLLSAGMVEPGLFQINITAPQGVPSGDQPVIVTVNDISSPAATFLSMA